MDRIRIVGGRPLQGTIPISGAKNATLPLMIASLLTDQTLILDNVPRLADVSLLQRILSNHGVDMMVPGKRPGESQQNGHTIHIVASRIVDTTAPYDLVSKMRASFWVIAPLVARMGEAKVSMPGGCAIGTRPVDLLIMALERLGAQIEIDGGYVIARAKDGLKGGEIKFPKVTVSGTHTALMAAVLARGTTVIENAAQEPEIGDVADCLNKMGARVSGIGTSRLIIEGVTRLGGARHSVLPDRIETGTYAMAVAMTGGDVLLQGARPELLQSALDVLGQAGAEVSATNEGIRIKRNGAGLSPVNVTTDPFPGFPTDLQAQLMALMTMAKGTSRITETIFENRFMHVQELARLGARIALDGQTAVDLTGQSRATLAAVAANTGSLFSDDESTAAAAELQHRFNDAMKPYVVIARHTGDYASLYKAASDYMDQAGAVERATPAWLQQRQALLEGSAAAQATSGQAPDTGNENDPIRALLDSSTATDSAPTGDIAAQARALLDDQINQAKDNGQELVFDPNRKTGQQADLSAFDNQMLATISLNQSGTFSAEEVRAAKTELDRRTRTSLLSALNSSNTDPSAGSLAMIQQYASMSAEERSVLGVTNDVMNRLVQSYKSMTTVQNSLSSLLSSTGTSSYF